MNIERERGRRGEERGGAGREERRGEGRGEGRGGEGRERENV